MTENIEEEESPFLFHQLAYKLKERQFSKALIHFINCISNLLSIIVIFLFHELIVDVILYSFGNFKVTSNSLDYWLMYTIVLYAIFSCFEIAFVAKHFIFSDISQVYFVNNSFYILYSLIFSYICIHLSGKLWH